MPSIITFGEMLIDFVPTTNGVSLSNATTFIKAAGGAPANVAVGLARLGLSCGFMGQVGNDAFGHFLAHTLQENNVDTTELKFSPRARTALAFVSLKADGERDFMFYRHPSADMLYSPDQVGVTLATGQKTNVRICSPILSCSSLIIPPLAAQVTSINRVPIVQPVAPAQANR